MSRVTRLKLVVNNVNRAASNDGSIQSEEIIMSAVTSGDDNAANKQWSKWTPTGRLSFTVTNPAVFEKILPGQFYYCDLLLTDKDSL
jgi:hypothetical protein